MRQDDELFSRKSKAYRAQHLQAVKALYGDDKPPTIKPRKKPRVNTSKKLPEWYCQAEIVEWARNLGLPLISIPNQGKRSYWIGQKEISMGLFKGATDLMLIMPSNPYHGYFIEIKALGNKPRQEQIEFMKMVRKYGYKADYFDDPKKAIESIENYLKGMHN